MNAARNPKVLGVSGRPVLPGATKITYTMLVAPYYKYSRMGPKTLF